MTNQNKYLTYSRQCNGNRAFAAEWPIKSMVVSLDSSEVTAVLTL